MQHSGTELLDPAALLARVGVEEGWLVADLGCGSLGHFVFPAARAVGAQGKVYGVDIQRTALQMIERIAKREQFWNVYPIWSDIEKVGAAAIPVGSLDLTLIVNNLYLAGDREAVAKEAWRLTKPGGLVLVVEWDRTAAPLGPPLETRLAVEEAQQCFEGVGWMMRDRFDAGDHHYGLLFQRPTPS